MFTIPWPRREGSSLFYRALAVLAFDRRRHWRLLPPFGLDCDVERAWYGARHRRNRGGAIRHLASRSAAGCAHAEQEGAETLTPLLRRKTLIGSGSEECPTCAPNQRRSTQPPVTVTGRVTSEPGCSRGDPTHPTNEGISCRLQRWPAMERR